MDVKFEMMRLALGGVSAYQRRLYSIRADYANAADADSRCERHDLVSRAPVAASRGGGGGGGG